MSTPSSSQAGKAGHNAVRHGGSNFKPKHHKPKPKPKSKDANILHYLNSIASAQRERNQGIHAANDLYRRGRGDNQHIYKEVRDYLNSLNSKNAAAFKSTAAVQAAATAVLQNNLSNTSSVNRGLAEAEQARLGIQGSGMGQFDADANNASLVAAQTGANDVSNTNAAGVNAAAVGNLILGMNKGQYQSNAGQLRNKHTDALTGLNDDFRDFKLDQMGRIDEYRARKAEQDRQIAEARAAQARQQAYYSSQYRRYSGGGSSYSGGGSSAASRAAQNRNTINAIGAIGANNPSKPKAGSLPDFTGHDPDLVKLLFGPLS